MTAMVLAATCLLATEHVISGADAISVIAAVSSFTLGRIAGN